MLLKVKWINVTNFLLSFAASEVWIEIWVHISNVSNYGKWTKYIYTHFFSFFPFNIFALSTVFKVYYFLNEWYLEYFLPVAWKRSNAGKVNKLNGVIENFLHSVQFHIGFPLLMQRILVWPNNRISNIYIRLIRLPNIES